MRNRWGVETNTGSASPSAPNVLESFPFFHSSHGSQGGGSHIHKYRRKRVCKAFAAKSAFGKIVTHNTECINQRKEMQGEVKILVWNENGFKPMKGLEIGTCKDS